MEIGNETLAYLVVWTHGNTRRQIETHLSPVEEVPKTLPHPVLADLVRNDNYCRGRGATHF